MKLMEFTEITIDELFPFADKRNAFYKKFNTVKFYKSSNGLMVMIDNEKGFYHLSISHKGRIPCYDELKKARYTLLPQIRYMAMIFPPESEFRDIMPYCLHLFEMRPDEITSYERYKSI